MSFSEGDVYMQLRLVSQKDPKTGVFGPFQPNVICSIGNQFVTFGYDAEVTDHFADFLKKFVQATRDVRIPRRMNVRDDVESARDELAMFRESSGRA